MLRNGTADVNLTQRQKVRTLEMANRSQGAGFSAAMPVSAHRKKRLSTAAKINAGDH